MDSNIQSGSYLSTGTMSVALIGGTKKDYIRAQDKFGELGIVIPWHYESDKSNTITIPKGCEGIVAFRKISHRRLRAIVSQANGLSLPWTMVDIGSSARERLMDLRKRAGFTKLPLSVPEVCLPSTESVPNPIVAEPVIEETKTMEEEKKEIGPEMSNPPPPVEEPSPIKEIRVAEVAPPTITNESKKPMRRSALISCYKAKESIRDLLQEGMASAPDLAGAITGERHNNTVARAIKEMIANDEIQVVRLERRGQSGGQPARILELVRKKPEKKKTVVKKEIKRTPVVETKTQSPAPVVHAATDLRKYFLIRLEEKMKDPETADKIILVLLQNGLLNT